MHLMCRHFDLEEQGLSAFYPLPSCFFEAKQASIQGDRIIDLAYLQLFALDWFAVNILQGILQLCCRDKTYFFMSMVFGVNPCVTYCVTFLSSHMRNVMLLSNDNIVFFFCVLIACSSVIDCDCFAFRALPHH